MRRTIGRMLDSASAEFEHEDAASVADARELLEKGTYDLVLCDVKMSDGESGLTLVEEIEAAPDEIAVLMVTVNDDPEVARKAAGLGANGYLVKPFTVNELMINVDNALRDGARRKGNAAVERENEERRIREVRGAMLRLEREAHTADEQAAQLLRPLSEAVGRRDLETGAHIRRIGESAALLAALSDLDPEFVEAIRLAAPMHDVGKVAIPDSVLLKPGKLDPSERQLVERHAAIGHDILSGSNSALLDLAAEIANTHHEKVDGSGYPQGLMNTAIPIAGRIVAVADVYDALTSNRPYRPALSVQEAKEIMIEGRGTHFDAALLDLFFEHLGDVQALGDEFADTQPLKPESGDRRVGDRRTRERRQASS